MSRRLLTGAGLAVAALVMAAGAASAGTWVQVSCVNPDGSAASSEGWSSSSSGGPGYGSSNGTNCGPSSGMFGVLGATDPEPVGASEILQYTPPTGSTLIGGQVDVDLHADGGGYNASGTAVLYEPAFAYPDDVFFQCAEGLANCSASGHDYAGVLSLPTNRGGSLYVVAGCGGAAGYQCTTGDSAGNVSSVQVLGAHLLLSNSAVPQAANITGTALGKNVTGTGHLLMSASDPSGPGVYAVAVAIDGRAVYAGTPNSNGGACVSLGVDPSLGAPMFDHQQPCPVTEQVAVPVPTAAFSDGRHELTATVVDAAGNQSPVLDQFITTSNPQLTPASTGKGRVHMRFKIKWQFKDSHTRALRIWTERAPRRGRVTVRCVGRHCPKLKVAAGAPRHLAKVISSLVHSRFTAGQKLMITVRSPHLRAERIEIGMRYGRKPSARLLTS
jgi:hypothetical protein